MKQEETLYDAFLNCLIDKEFKTKEDYIAFKGAEFGAKWQKEQDKDIYLDGYVDGSRTQAKLMYSEEEVIKILYCFHYDLVNSNFDTKEKWFEQFKK